MHGILGKLARSALRRLSSATPAVPEPGLYDTLGLAMVKNECDIIEAFARHNLAFLDAMVVLDNGSTDGTRELLLALQREGLPLVILDDPIVGYFQAEKITATYRRVVPLFQPRFVVLLDADEFIDAPSRDVFFGQLERLPAGSQGKYYWQTYVPSPGTGGSRSGDVLRDITHRRVRETPRYPKSIIACHPAIDSELVVNQGGHEIVLEGQPLPAMELVSVSLAHFPVRSAEQLASKVLVGWLAYMVRNPEQSQRSIVGYQWKHLYNTIVHGNGLGDDDLTKVALTYAQQAPFLSWPEDVVYDPIEPGYQSLSLHVGQQVSPLQRFARSAERVFLTDPRLNFGFLSRPAEITAPGGKDSFTAIKSTCSSSSQDFSEVVTSFNEQWHHDNLYVDLPPFRHLAERYLPQSVLDLGCGVGAYLAYFASQGATAVLGVDGFEMRNGFVSAPSYLRHDLAQPLDLGRTFDLVLCVEVIEHIRPDCALHLIDTITRHAEGQIVFSAGQPGQPGLGHINLKSIVHWLDAFAERGWFADHFDTLAVRSLATFSWFRRNLVVLSRRANNHSAVRNFLHGLEAEGGDWPEERLRRIAHPLANLEMELPRVNR